MLLRMIGKIKVSQDRPGLDAFLSSFYASRRCTRNRPPSPLPVSPMYNYFAKTASYAVDDIG